MSSCSHEIRRCRVCSQPFAVEVTEDGFASERCTACVSLATDRRLRHAIDVSRRDVALC